MAIGQKLNPIRLFDSGVRPAPDCRSRPTDKLIASLRRCFGRIKINGSQRLRSGKGRRSQQKEERPELSLHFACSRRCSCQPTENSATLLARLAADARLYICGIRKAIANNGPIKFRQFSLPLATKKTER